MIFSGGLCEKVLDGSKTQTRRPVRNPHPCRCRPGRRYAVQPGRGKLGLGFILVSHVSSVPVEGISAEDAAAEGFPSPEAFYDRWRALYGHTRGRCWRIVFSLA